MNEKFILNIIEIFNSGSIAELEIGDGTYHLTLRKERSESALPSSAAVKAENPVHLGIGAGSAVSDGDKITSPIVATFYASPKPDSPPFVKPGTKVKAGQTICILEAMKMMNHLEADFDCEIKETHASSGDLVEYGQTLFTVKRL